MNFAGWKGNKKIDRWTNYFLFDSFCFWHVSVAP